MYSNIYQQRLVDRRKASGLCIKCGAPLDRAGVYCKACRMILNKNKYNDYHFYQEHGICPICRQNIILGDEKMCLECRTKKYERVMSKRDKAHYNSVHKKWAKKEYDRRKEMGICTRCGKRKADSGYFTCGICREKDRTRKRSRYGKPDRKERYTQGLCYFCDNPIKEGYKVCEKHYQMNIEKAHSPKAEIARLEMKKELNKKIQARKSNHEN